jgi:hypothetical protein
MGGIIPGGLNLIGLANSFIVLDSSMEIRMAFANASKAAIICVSICLASASLTGIQLSGITNFSWNEALENFPEWASTAPNTWLLITTTLSAIFAILGAWAAIVQLRTQPGATRPEVAQEVGRTLSLLGDVGEQIHREGQTSKERDKSIFEAIKAERIGYTPDDIRQGRISDHMRDKFIDALVEQALKNRGVTDEQALEFATVAVQLAQSKINYHREAAAMILEGKPEEAADYLIIQSRAGGSARFIPAAPVAIIGIMGWLLPLQMQISEARKATKIYRIVNQKKALMWEQLFGITPS